MSPANPYQPPEASATVASRTDERTHPTRMRAALAGAWRGAKLDFWTVSIIFWTIGCVGLALAALILAFRSEMIPGTTAAEIALSVGQGLFVLLVMIPLGGVLYGSLPGGLIMGAFAAMRWPRPTDFESVGGDVELANKAAEDR